MAGVYCFCESIGYSDSTRPQGTGSGLQLIQEMLKMYGGTFEIESQQGKGTKVTVTLPNG